MEVHNMQCKHVLITDRVGFIGSFTARILSKNEIEVKILDCFSKQMYGDNFNESFLPHQTTSQANKINGSVNNKADIIAELVEKEAVIYFVD